MTRSAADLVRDIVDRGHAPFRCELAAAQTLLDREGSDEPLDALRSTFASLRDDLVSHFEKEELVLLPHVVEMERAAAGGKPPEGIAAGLTPGVVSVMQREHRALRLSLLGLMRLASEPSIAAELRARLSALDDALRRHMALEDDVLFPRALELERRLRASPY